MRAEDQERKDAHPTKSRTIRRLRWYPRSWRARYGDELVALSTTSTEDVSRPVFVGAFLLGGLRQRARQSGLTGESAPAAEESGPVRSSFSPPGLHSRSPAPASPSSPSTSTKRCLTHGCSSPSDLAFTVLQTVAGVASVLVVIGALLAAPCLRAISPSWRLGLSARTLPASSRLYGSPSPSQCPLLCGPTTSHRINAMAASTGTGYFS